MRVSREEIAKMDFVNRMAFTLERNENRIRPLCPPGPQSRRSMMKEMATICLPVTVVFMVVGVFSQDDPQAMVALVLGIICLLIKDYA